MSEKFLETIKSINGKAHHLKYHQKRLDSVLNFLNSAVEYNLEDLLDPPLEGLYKCRVVYDKANIEVTYIPYVKKEVKSLKIIHCNSIEYDKKYENRDVINKLFIQKEKCDDILIVKDLLVKDTSISNIAFYNGENWITPKSPLLQGTTKTRLIESGFLLEQDIYINELKLFSKVALMNAMIDFDIIIENNLEELIC